MGRPTITAFLALSCLCLAGCPEVTVTHGTRSEVIPDGPFEDAGRSSDGGTPGLLLSEDFEGLPLGTDPPGWLDTGADNSLEENDALFAIAEDGDNRAFGGPSQALVNVHSNYVAQDLLGGEPADWSDYEFTGRFRYGDDVVYANLGNQGFGVLVYSQYPNRDAYYRLAIQRVDPMKPTSRFYTSGHGDEQCMGMTTSDVVAKEKTWYRFRVRIRTLPTKVSYAAAVWEDGEPEPVGDTLRCESASEQRLTKGTVGLWSNNQGRGFFDDLQVRPL